MKEIDEEIEDFEKKQKRMDLLNSKISLILPELMHRNLKLIKRLNNKLKVSSFFNNIENRNKKYFHDFICSSDKRAKDLKTGLKINKAIEQNSKSISLLCRQMSDDIILKKANLLLREKKLISENTEHETHMKINKLINNLKKTVKTSNETQIKPIKTIIKSLSHKELKEAQDYIGDKIIIEQKRIQDKINKYLKKLHISLDKYANDEKTINNNNNEDEENDSLRSKKIKRKKEFNKYVENIYMNEHIKFINYTKPKPSQIKDKEGANLKRIKYCLFPPSMEYLINNQYNNDDINESDINSNQSKAFLNNNKKINRNSSMINIKSNINKKNNDKNIISELNNINVNGKDTLEVLKSLANQEKYLSERINKKMEKVNSLIEVNLPFPKNYQSIINYCKNKQILKDKNKYKKKNNFTFYPSPNKNYTYINFNKKSDLPELSPNMGKKISFIKNNIKNNSNNLGCLGYQTVNHKNGFKNINKNKGI